MAKGFGESAQQAFYHMPHTDQLGLTDYGPLQAKLKVGPGGRVVIPAAMREKLGVSEGQALMATLEDGELKLITMAEAVKRAQALVRESVPRGRSLVDELIAERRLEAMREFD